tara:strand:+ start:2696 stop:3226 length:531 start_codon:yes stop_codon:yes gene_type:complete
MFGHNALNYGNIGSLLHQAENKVFNAGATLYPKGKAYDCADKVFIIKPTNNPTYYSHFTESGEKKGSNIGNQQMSHAQKVQATAGFMPAGSYYVLNQADFPKADCAEKNRDGPGSDGCCGDCKDGYKEDSTGTCVEVEEEITTQTDAQVEPEEGNNTLLYGVIAVAVLGGAFMFLK